MNKIKEGESRHPKSKHEIEPVVDNSNESAINQEVIYVYYL